MCLRFITVVSRHFGRSHTFVEVEYNLRALGFFVKDAFVTTPTMYGCTCYVRLRSDTGDGVFGNVRGRLFN